jgi:hypothetical protein
VEGKYKLVDDAFSRKYDSTSTELDDGEDGMISSMTATEHANMDFQSVNVLNVGEVQMDKSVI